MKSFEPFRLDTANHCLWRAEERVPIAPKAFDVLSFLVENPGRLVRQDELLDAVWPDTHVNPEILRKYILDIRKILGDRYDKPMFIETVTKRGYRFVAPVLEESARELTKSASGRAEVAYLDEPAQRCAQQEAEPPAANLSQLPHTSQRGSSIRARSLLAGLLVIALGVFGYVAYRGRSVRKQPPTPVRSIAVLPFQNLQNNDNDDFLGFSLADAVITKLSYVSELAVRPSYAVRKYSTQEVDISRVATDLNVEKLLTGTFLHEGDSLRIACQLIDMKSQNILWQDGFDVKYDKLLTVQDNVTQHVIRGLELTLSPSEAKRIKPGEAISPLAYEYNLRGVDLYSKGDFRLAIQMFERSGELAPSYASTWANLGRSYSAAASFQFGGQEQYRKAQAAFEQALTLQPDQIDARIYMANMFTDTGRVEKAVPLLREALKANPNHAEIHWELGYAYRFAGMLQESASECERARQLDPGVKLTSSTLNAYLYLGQYDRFLASLPKSDDSSLVVFYRGFGEYYKKNPEEAAKEFDRAFELDHSLLQAQIGKALSFAIHHEEPKGSEILHSLENKIAQRGVGDPEAIYKIAQAYAVLGDPTSAMRVLKNSVQSGFFPFPYLATDPLIADLRKQTEFTELLTAARHRHEAFQKMFF